MNITYKHPLTLSLIIALTLSGCATGPEEKFSPRGSYLQGGKIENKQSEGEARQQSGAVVSEEQKDKEKFRFVTPLKLNTQQAVVADDVLNLFNEQNLLKITADSLPLKDYLHHVLGEQLNVSYVLADEVNKDGKAVTLNLQDEISARKLFTLTEEVLAKRDYVIRYDDGIFYIHQNDGGKSKGDIVYGYGKDMLDIPNSSAEIIQMVPFEYGMQQSLGNTLRVLLGVKSIPDKDRNSITVQGKRKDIVKALELIRLMDRPTLRDRQIGLFNSTFIDGNEITKKLQELLGQEGISVSKGASSQSALSVVSLDKQGTLIFFANNQQIINRAVFWAEQIDQPLKTNEKQYFIYAPRYSRAVDMGESLEALISNTGGGSLGRAGSSTSATSQNQSAAANRRTSRSASSEKMKMVVDERANSLIFYSTGEDYQQLLPLIKRLDVLPKQVMLEVMIAEVTLTDEFKQGVEFAFSRGSYGFSTAGAFMGDGFGGLSYLLKGSDGQIAAELLQTNSLVNLLSKPSLVVRDGVSASINVGTDIPIVGETTSDPISGDNQTTAIEYRKTGVELTVTPTVNAQGVILMEIKQKISNQVEVGATTAISPSVFERSVDTEVVAESGQTIILAGLISENRTQKDSKVPFFGDLPFIGGLFKANTDAGDKTELVVLVTPRVIESADEWSDIKERFTQGLEKLTLD
ncbi:secretin N-terminal domain-containing protein [Thalassomonas actiniarum]|uniref:General secretion pathway protein GspD n=1 Tax=Thalassomonas actiniarum TaxID=485447 RepID=A0AAF0C4Y2_9GAMM|nr:secretin N-terminal domain-containing protein [Thalassomonas actiniarum]WDE00526.1 general secretion pathway protein GspD [Thalassomonas actiniarum]